MKSALIIIGSFSFLVNCNNSNNYSNYQEVKKNNMSLYYKNYRDVTKSKDSANIYEFILKDSITDLNLNFYINHGNESKNMNKYHTLEKVILKENTIKLFYWSAHLDEEYIELLIRRNKLYITKLYQKDHWMNFIETVCKKDTLIELSKKTKIDFYKLMDNSKWKCNTIIIDSTAYQKSLPK
ncbi:MAG: hypothetical protein JST62_01765 [Bacteroidetes bacterium]|jgi:hypothetical protein|nr:hypothetical protein [Bacteroidota bacterium]